MNKKNGIFKKFNISLAKFFNLNQNIIQIYNNKNIKIFD